jgi:hypothetical protein
MAMMQERQVNTHGQRSEHGLTYELVVIVCGFIAGSVLPFVLFLLLVGIPVSLGFGIGWMVDVLGLPEPFDLIVWYVAIGAIGGILPGSAKWAYAGGLILFFGVFGRTLPVWPWVVGGLLAWIALDLLARWTDVRQTNA